jgi:hypothetical protein
VIRFLLWASVICGGSLAASGSARAVDITPELVCEVKSSFGRRPWSREACEQVSEALRRSREPDVLFAVCINESTLRARAIAWTREGDKADAGLCGVRCQVDAKGRCTNGLVRRMRLIDLLDPAVNVSVASRILAAKGSLGRYAGETRDRGYASRVLAIAAALGGARVEVKSKRVREIVRRILVALNRDLKS